MVPYASVFAPVSKRPGARYKALGSEFRILRPDGDGHLARCRRPH